MAVSVSSTSTTVRRRPFCPWSSSTRLFSLASSKALKRGEICMIQSTFGTCPNMTMLSSFSQFHRSSHHVRTSPVIYNRGKSVSREIVNQQNLDGKRKHVSRNFSSAPVQEAGRTNPHRPLVSLTANLHTDTHQRQTGTKRDWVYESERIKKSKCDSTMKLWKRNEVSDRINTVLLHANSCSEQLDKSNRQGQADDINGGGSNPKSRAESAAVVTEPKSKDNNYKFPNHDSKKISPYSKHGSCLEQLDKSNRQGQADGINGRGSNLKSRVESAAVVTEPKSKDNNYKFPNHDSKKISPYSKHGSCLEQLDKSNRQGQADDINGRGKVLSPKNHAAPVQVVTEPKSTDNKNKAPNLDSKKKSFYSKQTNEDVPNAELRKRLTSIYSNVLVVDNVSAAKKVVRMLTCQYRHLVHACDTEVAKIDVKQETPVDHGEVICFSIYSGPEADFGNGKSCIWVDVLDGGGSCLLNEFAPFFEDPSIRKVWHNYSFDNHVIENYGLKVSGFHADTMHMARLWDSSRRTEGGYSLEALTGNQRVMSDAELCHEKDLFGKISMKKIFGKNKLKKDGSEGKIITIPPVEELQREERESWICYSALDSISTLKLYESMKMKLSRRSWKLDSKPIAGKSMYDFYQEYWRPFGEILVKMETEGMLVDREYLAEMEKVARAEQKIAADRFRNWASKYCSDAKYMNVGSDTQLRQLLFGGIVNSKDPNESLPNERIFKIPNVEKVIEEGKKIPGKYRNITLHSVGVNLPVEIYTATGWPSVSGDALKTLAGKISAEYDFIDEANDLLLEEDAGNVLETMPDEALEANDSTDSKDVDTSAYGTAFGAFGEGQEGREACHAIASLCEMCSIDSLISNFILPLQGSNVSGKNGRVHCSLNINTETGRLSARRPNLQNQPALEKDRYKIRQAFIAAPGNSLIVADYGQLELRILAHLAECKSMLDAFKAGGDFHSRTAMNMYEHIRDAVETEQVLLEWYPQPGEDKPPVPLLKDAFASERRKAKMLNFSIAYGKTPMGLARDWKVSVEEAKNTVDLWYKERKEVLKWQEDRKKEARKDGCVHTLLGRARRFPSLHSASRAQKNHIERAAINTPVQGSAADVAMCAMLEISNNARLKELGWRLLLQVHDEVILEGPSESAEVAKAIMVECMAKPFNGKNILKVDLSVDAKCAQNWYAGK